MKFQFKEESEFKLIINNAITWFDELVRINGCQCSTSTFIHNMLIKVYTEAQTDGKMLWDKEMIERAYPIVISDIKQEQLDEILNIIRNDVPVFIGRRLKDGK